MKNLFTLLLGITYLTSAVSLMMLAGFSKHPISNDLGVLIFLSLITGIVFAIGIGLIFIWWKEREDRRFGNIQITEDPDKAINEIINSQYDW